MPRYDIGPKPPASSGEVIQLLTGCETATIGHWRLWGFCDRRIQGLLSGHRVAGRAITVALPGPCSTLLHYAIDQLEPGDILVVDRLGDDRYACWGGGVTVAVKAAGGVAGVVDGPCTDLEEMQASAFPMWSRGLAPITTRLYDLGGRLNQPVSVGGVVVNPGDYVLCDESGVLILPPEQAEQEARRALKTQENGLALQNRVAAGGAQLAQETGARKMVEDALGE